jgi:chemotaxis protein CheC
VDRTPPLDDVQKRLLTTIFERAAESASQALSIWLSRHVHIQVTAIDEIDLAEATEILGPSDALVAACSMDLVGRLTGEILLVFADEAGLALADLLLQQPLGTSTTWGELEQSAACETANIVGCALLNSLATHLPALSAEEGSQPLVPSPPTFRHEFAGSLLEFALMNQAMLSDRVMLARTCFTSDGQALNWSLLYVPGYETLGALRTVLGGAAS